MMSSSGNSRRRFTWRILRSMSPQHSQTKQNDQITQQQWIDFSHKRWHRQTALHRDFTHRVACGITNWHNNEEYNGKHGNTSNAADSVDSFLTTWRTLNDATKIVKCCLIKGPPPENGLSKKTYIWLRSHLDYARSSRQINIATLRWNHWWSNGTSCIRQFYLTQ